jgi:hypothetical protein
MKEAYKYLDDRSFDGEEEALVNVSVSDAQYAVRLGIIEEFNSLAGLLQGWTEEGVYAYVTNRIATLKSKQNKLNEPV